MDTRFPKLSRRRFLSVGPVNLSLFYATQAVRPWNVRAATAPVKLRGTAEQCIFIFLSGGISQIDSFDMKEGRWTPPDFDVRAVKGGLAKWPYALFPRLPEKLDDIAIVRSTEAWEAGHARAQFYAQVAHPISPARRNEMPSIGAVIAHEMDSRRKAGDFLPPFVAMNFGAGGGAGLIGAGCLDPKTNPLALDTKAKVDFVLEQSERTRFNRRWELLRKLEAESSGMASRPVDEYASQYAGAHSMMLAERIGKVLNVKPEDRAAYGGSALGDACVLARNLVSAGAGTRYVLIHHGGWDFHANIYDKTKASNQYSLSHELDSALSSLLTDLRQIKARDGSALLDKTLVVCMGEFGRTVGDLTVNKGRDHNRFAGVALFAGAGVKGAQIIGATDETGGRVADPGWNRKRPIYPEDVTATIYSTLGIDWTKRITNTPSGRAFEYIESMSGTTFLDVGEIEPLFG